MKVSFFVTCIADNVLTNIGIKSIELLEELGCDVVFNPKQTCCGQPLANTGYHKKAKKSMRVLIDALLEDGCDYVVAPSGSCVLQVKEFPHFFRDEAGWADKATVLVDKTFEITDFIVNVLKVTDVGASLTGRAAYHPSCHMSRLLGVKEPPILLLQHVSGLQLVPFKGQDKCCGFGGTFAVKMADLSGAMVTEKVQNIAAAGVDYVIGADGACLMNIEGCIKREGYNIRVYHVVEVLMMR
ncbi:(Fe-S)-binding protein [candidate division KSB1 bacterium]|nr:(Fe-S)-binding protein [candidate division KSB1 bacterium]RQW06969.1 MAG: (Fe-S)-binding protein [candidate division KSB1 bacterium]